MRVVAALLTMVGLLPGQTANLHIKAALAAYQAGEAAQRDKQYQLAIDSLRQAIEIEPTFLEAYESLITAHLDSGDRLGAATSITEFLEIRPEAVHYRVLLGQILLEQKQAERALAQFSLALQTDPYNADGLLGFAASARQMGMEERAAQAIELGRKHYPSDERFKTFAGSH